MKRIRDKVLLSQLHRNKRFCVLCGRPSDFRYWPGHGLHHIFGGANRHDVKCNLIMLCWNCHQSGFQSVHCGDVSRGMVLMAKMLREPAEYDPEELSRLVAPRIVPEPEPLPEWAMESWRKWRG